MQNKKNGKTIEALTHTDARRRNIPTAEFQSVVQKEANDPLTVAYPRNAEGLDEEKTNRNRDLDPQLSTKDERTGRTWWFYCRQFIQGKVHPKVLIDDLLKRTASDKQAAEVQTDLFADFNGIPTEAARPNFIIRPELVGRMILGTPLDRVFGRTRRPAARCNAFVQPARHPSSTPTSVVHHQPRCKGRQCDHITRGPERSGLSRTWRDGIHSYRRISAA